MKIATFRPRITHLNRSERHVKPTLDEQNVNCVLHCSGDLSSAIHNIFAHYWDLCDCSTGNYGVVLSIRELIQIFAAFDGEQAIV